MPVVPYNLPGSIGRPQVEPESSFWPRCPVPRPVAVTEVLGRINPVVGSFPDPDDSAETRTEASEFAELRTLYQDCEAMPANLSPFLTEERYFRRPPEGAILSMDAQSITNGIELATLFEAETPGLWHRHVLNILLNPATPNGLGQRISPPRQALIWATLDVAIHSALSVAWHYKWLADGETRVRYRRRPAEYAISIGEELPVLYDFAVSFDDQGRLRRDQPRTAPQNMPQPSPGTPRHPAYPSGHSTYSAAASFVLGCFFEEYREAFRLLADNIGIARLYGGVHWRTDHEVGQTIGVTVGQIVMEQLGASDIPVMPDMDPAVPDAGDLSNRANDFGNQCGNGTADFCAMDFASQQRGIMQNIAFADEG